VAPPPESVASPQVAAATRANARVEGEVLLVEVGGAWRVRSPRPAAELLLTAHANAPVRRVVVSVRDLGDWDSSLLLFVQAVRRQARARGWADETRGLPAIFTEWLGRLDDAPATAGAAEERFPITRRIGNWTQDRLERGHELVAFLGECVLAGGRVLARPDAFRWADCIFHMRRCGAQALGIVGLISFLVGVILAFVGATQFRQVGADIYVADLVGLAVFREMGPMMAAIVLAGRTGAAYAAELGNMRLNEEIDALETFGLRALDFLVMPRLVALALMMPLLAVYADIAGVLGGMFICGTALDMSAATYFHRLQEAIGLLSFGTGLLKSFFFGMIVAYAGCLKGMRAERSAIGVGEATTAAVVLGILLIIIADAIFTVLFHFLRW
jgi:phospholipid/cholesterol/gamma-HCH transport system permease protein